jgi:TonB-linked SusC/RagA family outer membrane protein
VGVVLSIVAASTLLVVATPVRAQQQAVLGGRVVDQDRNPIVNASVLLVGTNRGTMTNDQGRFLLVNIEPGRDVTLRVTQIGYASRTVETQGGVTDLVVELQVSAINLDELVVTGTASGTQVKRALGNSVTEIRAEEAMEVVPAMDVSELLNARSPGVVVTSGTGQAGSGPVMNIRGSSSFSLSAQPLIYVDGVRLDNAVNSGISVMGFGTGIINRLNDINPEDIESIEIIKGPAAATLYGTEASNGVIQILTKKGRAGEAQIDLRVRQGVSYFRNAEERIPDNWGIDPATGEAYAFNIFESERKYGKPDIWRNAHLQGYTASVRGGTEAVRYFLSGDLDQDQGIDPDNQMFRVGTRANITVLPTEKLEINASIGLQNGKTDLACEAGCGGRTWATYYSIPETRDDPLFRGFRGAPPEIRGEAFKFWQDIRRSQISLQFNHRPTDWLSHRLQVGQDQVTENNEQLWEKMSSEFIPYYGEFTRQGGKYHQIRDVSTYTFDYSATGNWDVTSSLSSATTVGAQYYHKYEERSYAQGNVFPTAGLTVVDAAAENYGGTWYQESNTLGLFVQEQVSLNDRIFITGAMRGDDNSAFGKNYDFVLYPKASVSWVISEEGFWNVSWVNALKLRSAYGESGQQPSAFAALRTFSPETGGGGVGVVTPSSVGNAELGPEVGKEFEIGFEAGLLNNRLGVDLTYYNAHTFDAILSREVPPSTGFPGSQFVNAGEIKNQGVEVALNALAFRGQNVQVDLNLSFSRNANEVVELGGVDQGVGFISRGSLRHVPGFPVWGWFRRKVVSAELVGTGKDAVAVNPMCDAGNPNGKKLPDGTPLELGGPAVPCDEAPRLYLGNAVPTTEGSIATTVTLFGNLRLYGLIDWKTGHKKLDNDTRIRCQIFNDCRANYFPEEYDPAVIANWQSPGTLRNFVINRASYAKLRELSATYTLPDEWAAAFRAQRASITVAGRNLAIFSDWPSLDPESGFQDASGTVDLEQNNIPNPTTILTTITLTF